MLDLSKFFEKKQPRSDKFSDSRQEIQAVSSGDKAMSVFLFPRSELGTTEFEVITSTAFDFGLSIIQHSEKIVLDNSIYEQVYIFVLPPEESWRVPAYIATRKVLREYQWSE